MSRADVLLDNPLLIKHVRSRLRRPQVLPWVVVLVVLCLCICWAGFEVTWIGHHGALGGVLGPLAAGLLVQHLGFATAFLAFAAVAGAGALVFLLLVPETRDTGVPRPVPRGATEAS